MYHRKDEPEAPSAALCVRTIELIFDMRGYVGFLSPMLWQFTHEFNKFFGGGSGLRLRQRRAQLGDDLVPHRDLDRRAGVLAHLAHQLRELLSRLADGEFHEAKCTRAYNTMQRRMDLGCQKTIKRQGPDLSFLDEEAVP